MTKAGGAASKRSASQFMDLVLETLQVALEDLTRSWGTSNGEPLPLHREQSFEGMKSGIHTSSDEVRTRDVHSV